MKNTVIALVMALSLGGCAAIQNVIPSFWDDNQSAKVVDIRLNIENLDCAAAITPQVTAIERELQWFKLYSQSKGTRQQDVIKILAPLQETVRDLGQRAQNGQTVNPTYCQIKKRIMVEQAARAATAILGRF
jgi:hypothetical protein